MASIQEIVRWIIQSFDPTKSVRLDQAIERALVQHGCSPYDAALLADKRVNQVLKCLQLIRSEGLPFELSTDEKRLIGNQRVLHSDTIETRQLRLRLAAIDPMLQAIYRGGNRNFESICARLMILSGASESYALRASDEGGIDVYGRVPLRIGDERIRQGLLHTTLLNKQLLFLGQCKCYNPSNRVGRPEIINFHGAVDACLNKYEGYERKPSHRVPEGYYRTRELCIRVFFTTAEYADGVESAAESQDILLISGRQIAEFLIYNRIGLSQLDNGPCEVDEQLLHEWAEGTINQAAVI